MYLKKADRLQVAKRDGFKAHPNSMSKRTVDGINSAYVVELNLASSFFFVFFLESSSFGISCVGCFSAGLFKSE